MFFIKYALLLLFITEFHTSQLHLLKQKLHRTEG